MATKSHHGANNRATSPQPGQESQDYMQTGDLDVNLFYSIFVDSVYVYFCVALHSGTDEDTERDGPVLLSPPVNGMADIHKCM